MDYDVLTKISFVLDFDGSGEFNMLLFPNVHQQFTEHVRKVYEQDETLRDYISSDLSFRFENRWVWLEYTFSCHDENKAEAESFSAYCVREVQKQLEEFGCKVKQVRCSATEADMTWLDQLEDAVFGPREQPPEEKGKSTAKNKKRSGQER